jgi:c-di-GMP-binding flagellar brake protein YcgR
MGARRSGRSRAGADGATGPSVNTSVRLSREGWPHAARTRVEDVTAQEIVVARPERAGPSLVAADVGDTLLLAWTSEDAMYEVPVTLVTAGDTHPPTWALRPLGPVRRQQRRASFRLEVRLSATLGTDAAAAGLAQVSDLSEGGLRCMPPDGPAFAEGDQVWVRLTLPDEEITLDATVVRVGHTGELGINFVRPPETAADRIRKFLFSEQIARRARLAE